MTYLIIEGLTKIILKNLYEKEYNLAYKKGSESYYFDDKCNVLIYTIKKSKSKYYMLDIKETKKNNMCTFSLYQFNKEPIKKFMVDFDSYGSIHNKALAARIFRTFRDDDKVIENIIK